MSEQQELVGYYQEKIDQLYRERLAWLSRFEECATQLSEKQQLMETVKTHRDREGDLRRHIYHHDIALLDEKYSLPHPASTSSRCSARPSSTNIKTPSKYSRWRNSWRSSRSSFRSTSPAPSSPTMQKPSRMKYPSLYTAQYPHCCE
jgi:hypothetical protein